MKAALVLVALLATAAHADPPAEPTRPPPRLERIDPPANARTEAWIATGITAALVGVTAFSVVRMKQDSDLANQIRASNGESAAWTAADNSTDRWFHATLVCGGLSVASVVVTGILWSRSQPSYRVAVTPQGAFVGYALSF